MTSHQRQIITFFSHETLKKSISVYCVYRLSSVTLVLRHYCNTVTMTLVSWCRNTKVTLHQIWYTLKYHQFCSKFEKKAFFIGSNLKNHHFPPKIWKKSSIATKIWKTSFLAKFEKKKFFLDDFFKIIIFWINLENQFSSWKIVIFPQIF